MKQLIHLTYTKSGINLKDSIQIISIKDAGVDIHGTLAENYTIHISNLDMQNAINHITTDTINNWTENEFSYMLLIYPNTFEDTLFGFSVLKSEPKLKIQLFK